MAPDDSGARGGLVTKSRRSGPQENSERRDEGVTARGGVVIPPSGLEPPGSQMEAQSPIPNPLPNDDEDVSWALSTAGALWGRGERAEALKWLRRAAEQASDVNDDVRSLELAKAAADVSGLVSTTTPPPPPSTSVPPPSTAVTPPPVASTPPPSTVAAPPPQVASGAPGGSFPPPPSRASAPPPPPRKGPPSLPPRNSRPPLPPSPSRSQAPPPPASTRPVPPQQQQPASTQAAPPQAAAPQPAPQPAVPQPATATPAPPRARQAQGNEAPSPVTKVSRVPSPASLTPQISPAARSMPGSALADAAVPGRRPEPAPQRAPTAVRTSVLGSTVPTRPVAFSPSPATTPLPPAATERLPPSRRGRVFDEIVALQQAPGGTGPFDDLDENTEVLNARAVPIAHKSTSQELDESFQGLIADPRTIESDAIDEPTDPGIRNRALDSAGDEQTGPVSVPERTVVFTAAERAALAAAPEHRASESTSRRFPPLLAHRVAVVASSTPGELRLVLLDPSGAPPVGAAIAMLVPLSTADGDEIAQLVGALE
jgi:hypothetical protein